MRGRKAKGLEVDRVARQRRRVRRHSRTLAHHGVLFLDNMLSAEDSATLSALMAIDSVDLNRERLEFLG